MKHLNTYITEYIVKKKLNKAIDSEHKYHPKTKEELIDNIKELLDKGETNLNCIDTSAVKDMSNLFNQHVTKIIIPDNVDISNWDVSNVENMHYMFTGCQNLICDLSKWNVSKVEDMSNMFYYCNDLNCKGLENWDVSNVKNMEGIFSRCKDIKFDISNWDVSNVTNMSRMFYFYKNFNCDLSNWNVSKAEDMNYMFYGCEDFDCDLSNWNVSKVTNMKNMFDSCKKFKGIGLENWDVRNVRYMNYMFYKCKNFNCDLSSWNVNNIKTTTDDMFVYCTSMKNTPSWY